MMTKHKVAKKVASSRSVGRDILNIFDWLEEVNPELLKQFNAIKDLEESVMADELRIAKQERMEFIQKDFMTHYAIWKKEQK
jgi:hypothetical protein